MLKPVIVATAVLALAGSSIVYAQHWNGPDGEGGPRFEHHHHQLSAEDRAAFTDARIAALKAGLALTPDQEKNWPAFEQSVRDMAQLRSQRIAARETASQQPQPTTTPFERLSRRADELAKTSAALKRIAEAGEPLYASLNDAQKERFKMLARLLRPHHMHGWRDGDGWRAERRFGRAGDGWHRQPRYDQERGGWREGQGFGHEGPRFGPDHTRIHDRIGADGSDEQESQL